MGPPLSGEVDSSEIPLLPHQPTALNSRPRFSSIALLIALHNGPSETECIVVRSNGRRRYVSATEIWGSDSRRKLPGTEGRLSSWLQSPLPWAFSTLFPRRLDQITTVAAG